MQLIATALGGKARLRVKFAGFEAPLRLNEIVHLKEIKRRKQKGAWEVDFELPEMDSNAPERVLVLPAFSGNGRTPVHMGAGLISPTGRTRRLTEGRLVYGGWMVASLGRAGRGEAATLRMYGRGPKPPPTLSPCVAPLTFP